MADKAQLMERGKTYYGALTTQADVTAEADNPNIEGIHRIFTNNDPSDTVKLRDGGEVEMIAVRNKAAVALLPKRMVEWAAGKEGSQVDGYTGVTQWGQVAGVIDEQLPSAGCRVDDICWIAIRGRHLVETDSVGNTAGAEHIDVGKWLVSMSAANSNNATLGGHPQLLLLASTATTQSEQLQNKFGIALTGKSTSSTSEDMLVDLKIA